MADFTVLPVAISSRIRAKMITFASTAIPIDRMIPAIPGQGQGHIKAIQQYQHQYRIHAAVQCRHARPGIRYTSNHEQNYNDQIRWHLQSGWCEMASSPSCAPTTLERSSSSSREREPIRMVGSKLLSFAHRPAIPLMTALAVCDGLVVRSGH